MRIVSKNADYMLYPPAGKNFDPRRTQAVGEFYHQYYRALLAETVRQVQKTTAAGGRVDANQLIEKLELAHQATEATAKKFGLRYRKYSAVKKEEAGEAVPGVDAVEWLEKAYGGKGTPAGAARALPLAEYWTHGEGAAKIRWGEGGDFDRCVHELEKHMPGRAKGYCAERHHEALGIWPATHAKLEREGKKAVTKEEILELLGADELPGEEVLVLKDTASWAKWKLEHPDWRDQYRRGGKRREKKTIAPEHAAAGAQKAPLPKAGRPIRSMPAPRVLHQRVSKVHKQLQGSYVAFKSGKYGEAAEKAAAVYAAIDELGSMTGPAGSNPAGSGFLSALQTAAQYLQALMPALQSLAANPQLHQLASQAGLQFVQAAEWINYAAQLLQQVGAVIKEEDDA